ncbi:hypothetical protein N7456_002367 [Penicillium angulare]|uniref:Uncharacterized protein n=1 Tax=Penicillium angulare TaxID=116970 RepID=A0A9W9KQ92_9EURO|nr:hypothetical protein N7456_002367 [Penicillium angulare]
MSTNRVDTNTQAVTATPNRDWAAVVAKKHTDQATSLPAAAGLTLLQKKEVLEKVDELPKWEYSVKTTLRSQQMHMLFPLFSKFSTP